MFCIFATLGSKMVCGKIKLGNDYFLLVPPMMTVPSQLERSRLGGNVSLRYKYFATLKTITYP